MANLLFKKGSDDEYREIPIKDKDSLYVVTGEAEGVTYSDLYFDGVKCNRKKQSDWSENDTESESYIRNRPVMRCVSYSVSGYSDCVESGYTEPLSIDINQPGVYQVNGSIAVKANDKSETSTKIGKLVVCISIRRLLDGKPTFINKSIKDIEISSLTGIFMESFSFGGVELMKDDQIVMRIKSQIPFCIEGDELFEGNLSPMTYMDAHTYILSNVIE